MSSFKKMSLVAAEELDRLKQKQLTAYNPELRSMVFLKDEMDTILTRNDLPADEKVKLFQVAQHRFDTLRHSVMQKPAAPAKAAATATATGDEAPEEVNAIEDDMYAGPAPGPSAAAGSTARFAAMVTALPQQYHKKGNEMLEFFDQHGDVFAMGPRGDLVIAGQSIPNSNFKDLFRYLYVNSHTKPIGLDSFVNALGDRNVPRSSLSNRNVIKSLATEVFHSPTATPSPSQDGHGRSRPPGKRPRILSLYKL
jgi:hypothetical protein